MLAYTLVMISISIFIIIVILDIGRVVSRHTYIHTPWYYIYIVTYYSYSEIIDCIEYRVLVPINPDDCIYILYDLVPVRIFLAYLHIR